MAFWIYTTELTAETATYQRQRTLRLAGVDGLIAGYLRFHRSAEMPWRWQLDAQTLSQLATPGTGWKGTEVLFQSFDEASNQFQLYRVLGINGQSQSMDTDLVFTLCHLHQAPNEEDLAHFARPRPLDERQMLEALGLSGGLRGGKYRWTSPKMNIGAAVIPSATPEPAHT